MAIDIPFNIDAEVVIEGFELEDKYSLFLLFIDFFSEIISSSCFNIEEE